MSTIVLVWIRVYLIEKGCTETACVGKGNIVLLLPDYHLVITVSVQYS